MLILAIDTAAGTIARLRAAGHTVEECSFGYRDGRRYCPVAPHEVDAIVFDLDAPACYDMTKWGPYGGNDNYKCAIVPQNELTWETQLVAVGGRGPGVTERLRYPLIDDMQITHMAPYASPFGPADVRQAIEVAGVPLFIFLNRGWVLRTGGYDFPNICEARWSTKRIASQRYSLSPPLSDIYEAMPSFAPQTPIACALDGKPEARVRATALATDTATIVSDRIGNELGQFVTLGNGHVWLLPEMADNGAVTVELLQAITRAASVVVPAPAPPTVADSIEEPTPDVPAAESVPVAPSSSPITAIVSYAHGSAEWNDKVLALVERLRGDGIDCTIDRYRNYTTTTWSTWMSGEIRKRRWVLVVASEAYARRANGEEDPGVGLGVIWEHGIIREELYQSGRINERFVPVGFGAEGRKFVPDVLVGYTYYDVTSAESYTNLLRALTDQPAVIPTPLGLIPRLPPEPPATNVASTEDISRRYQAEEDADTEFMHGRLMVESIGRYVLRVRPVEYAERVSRERLVDAFRATVTSSGTARIPHEIRAKLTGVDSGRGVQSVVMDPQTRRVEYVRFYRSGHYWLLRVFEEDYAADGTLIQNDTELWFEHFIRYITMLYLHARNVARALALQPTDLIEVRLRVAGLLNRKVIPFQTAPGFDVLTILIGAETGTEREHVDRFICSVEDIERTAVLRARQFIMDVLWNFAMLGPYVEPFVARIQREFIGATEPLQQQQADPPPVNGL